MRLVLFTLVAAVSGCYREAAPPAPPANEAKAPSSELLAKDPLAFLPRDSELVIDLDVARMKQSPLWASQIEPQLRKIVGTTYVEALRKACGIDYLQATTRLTTGMKKVGDHYTGIIVVRGPDAATTLTCIEQTAKLSSVTRDGDALLVTAGASTSMAIGSAGANTLVVLTEVGANRAMFRDTIAAGTPLRSSAAFMALYDALEPTASLALIANGASPMFEPIRSFGLSPRWVVATATVDASYVATGRITMKDADDAKRVAGMMQSNLGALKTMVERVDVRPEGEVVRVDVAVTKEQADKILGMLGGVFVP